VAPVAWFVAMAVLATLGGYPGVICVTPMAWLIGLAAGQRVAMGSRNAPGRGVLLEAAIAGALVGVIEGLLFVVIGSRAELRDATEVQQMLGWSACMVLLGVPVTAGLAVGMAKVRMRDEG
jgi:hypothetical protein